ncbi:helix-turn-helix domain-containing protein [Streptomyces sp. PRh5]|uniref:helix-turn-helix domain-containing protein n=1 Tax=Streptomyces sp. PRh5 TaxID=1158056 RepID=UPI0004B83047|nr:helix-turn-helix domain-containing protein [Streptomyces sp. PRh5]
MDATTPGLLAPDVLDRDDLRRALEEHDFAAAFSLIKKWGGLSQNRLAAACRLTPGKVSTIMNGSSRVTSIEVIRRISDGLRIPGHLVGLAPRPWENGNALLDEQGTPGSDTRQPGTDVVPWRPDATAGMAADLTRSDLVMDRRAATRAIAGAAVTGAPLLDALDGWRTPADTDERARRPGRLGVREVDELESTARLFRKWGRTGGGGLRRKAVAGQLAEVAAALEEHQAPAIERRLYRVMAQLAGTAASMAWDAGQQRRAQDYYRLALRAAHSGADTEFGANVLAGMARQMLYHDRPHDALELIRLAQDGARRTASPRLRAMLHTREAWALACMDRPVGFRRATGQAAEALSDAGPPASEPYWISYFDDAELAGVTGGRLLDMARSDPRSYADQAADHIRTALDRRGPEAGRGHALDWIGLAECAFLLGDISSAADYSRRAVEVASDLLSGRVRAQLAQLYPYTVGDSVPQAVTEVRASIRTLLTT